MTNCQQQQDDDDDNGETSSVTETAQSSLKDSTANLGQHGGLLSMSRTTATPTVIPFHNNNTYNATIYNTTVILDFLGELAVENQSGIYSAQHTPAEFSGGS